MTGGQQHTGKITSGQFGRIDRHLCLRNKKIKTLSLHKNNLNFYGNLTSGTFGVTDTQKADPMATHKDPLFTNALFLNLKFS